MALDRQVDKTLTAANRERNKKHKSSGKLSASMLGLPLQWQILKTVGASRKDIDTHTLRKFKRGDHVEEWLVSHMMGVIDTQVFCEYKGAIGYLDVLTDTQDYDFQQEKEMPHEIKSVGNFKFNRLLKEPQHTHALQGCMYALGLKKEWFILDYVSTDDYRIKSFVLEVGDYKDEVDKIIKGYNKALKDFIENRTIPEFEPTASWTKNKKYNNYPAFMELTSDEAVKLLEKGGNNESNS